MRRILFYIMTTAMICGSVMAGKGLTIHAMEIQDAAEQVPVAEENQPEMLPMNTFMQTNAEANLRKGPGKNYESSGKSEIGKTVMVTGKSPDEEWYRIIYDGEEVYIAVEYLTEQQADTAIDEELQQSADKAEAEIAQEMQEAKARAEQKAAEQAEAEKEAAEQEKIEAEAAEWQKEQKKAPYGFVIAVVFLLVFVLSLLVLMKKEAEQQEKEDAEQEEKNSKEDSDKSGKKIKGKIKESTEKTDKEADTETKKQKCAKGDLEIIDLEDEDAEE